MSFVNYIYTCVIATKKNFLNFSVIPESSLVYSNFYCPVFKFLNPSLQETAPRHWLEVPPWCLREILSALSPCSLPAVGHCPAFRASPTRFGTEDLFQVSALPPAFNLLHPCTCRRPAG